MLRQGMWVTDISTPSVRGPRGPSAAGGRAGRPRLLARASPRAPAPIHPRSRLPRGTQWFSGRSGGGGTPPPAKLPPGKPMLLIGFNEASRSWEANPEAMALLQRVPGPLATLAVCGRARQGKSFL